ncbi:MAG: sterol desaturase family protein [Deltaproteobacteria bacterium]|nr:sterol desaturase family protein [Deltaproteobacteria bacterium]
MHESSHALIQVISYLGALFFFLFFELAHPYRPSTVSKLKRWVINLSILGINTVILQLLFAGVTIQTARYVTSNQLGVLNMVVLPSGVKLLITFIFMDFILYVWHLLNHQVPLLWRFHLVHHTDLNMDVITANRFHVGELVISALIKISLIYFLGADRLGVLIFESLTLLSTQFHHSSLKAPGWFEKIFWILFVPPSMHRIHHSVVIKERNSNYGAILSVWDRIFGTLRNDVDQDKIRIGVGAYPKQERLNLHHLLIMPFTRPVR